MLLGGNYVTAIKKGACFLKLFDFVLCAPGKSNYRTTIWASNKLLIGSLCNQINDLTAFLNVTLPVGHFISLHHRHTEPSWTQM